MADSSAAEVPLAFPGFSKDPLIAHRSPTGGSRAQNGGLPGCWTPSSGESRGLSHIPEDHVNVRHSLHQDRLFCADELLLVTLSVAMHTGQLGIASSLSIVLYVCGAVVDSIQPGSLSVKRTIWRRCSSYTENSSQLRLLGTSLKSHLLRTDDMLAKLSFSGHEAPFCALAKVSRT